jgi:hypothetical protein
MARANAIDIAFPQAFIDRFWKNVRRGQGCWTWSGPISRGGYGKIGIQKRVYVSHRVAFFLSKGPIPEGIIVCHTCDNPPCCNPDHLWLGTAADNAVDRANKGRGHSQKGDAHPCAILTEQDVIKIRMDPRGAKSLARVYGVSRSTIRCARSGRTWGHIARRVAADAASADCSWIATLRTQHRDPDALNLAVARVLFREKHVGDFNQLPIEHKFHWIDSAIDRLAGGVSA